MLCLQKNNINIYFFTYYRVQRKSFLQLAIWASWTSFQPAPQTFWKAELISQLFSYSNFSKDITCPLGKLKTEFTHPIAKSPSPGLSDTTFFARCITLPTWCSLKYAISVYNVEGNVVDYHPVKVKNPSTSFYISVVWVPCSTWTSSCFNFSSLFFTIFKILNNSLIVNLQLAVSQWIMWQQSHVLYYINWWLAGIWGCTPLLLGWNPSHNNW